MSSFLSASLLAHLVQHDSRCPAGASANDGNLLDYHPVRLRLQPIEQDYRTSSVTLRDSPLRSIDRCSSREAANADLRGGEG